MEDERTKNYQAEIDEAIKQLNSAYTEYENIEFLINIQKMNEEEKKYYQEVVNRLRLYETHAYIRLKALDPKFETTHAKLEEARLKLKTQVPKQKDVEELVIQYNRIKVKDKAGDQFLKSL